MNTTVLERSVEVRDIQAPAAAIPAGLATSQALQERLHLVEAVVENFPGGIALFDNAMQMVLCNARLKEMLDYPETLFENGYPTLEELFTFNALRGEYGPGNLTEQVARRVALLREGKAHVYDRTRPNGTVLEVRGVPLRGGGFVTTYFDVTDQRRTQMLIAHMAHHDGLTDLPNRTLLMDRLTSALALAKRVGVAAIHYIDLDGFKKINDTLGHRAGDALLIGVAQRLRDTVRDHDTVARLGGDEFAIVQTGIQHRSDAAALARRVIERCCQPFEIDGHSVQVGTSIGIALAPIDGVTTDDVLLKADAALYRSKAGGRGCFTFHDEGTATGA